MKLSVNNVQQKNILNANIKNKQTQVNFNALNNSHRQNARVLPIALGGLATLGLLTACDEDRMQQVSTQATQPQTAAVAPSSIAQLSDKNQIKTGELLPADTSQLGTTSVTLGNSNVPLNQQVTIQGGPVYCIGNLSTPQNGSLTGFAAKNPSGEVRTYIAAGVSPQGQTCTPGTFVSDPILGSADGTNKFSDGSTPVSFYEYTPTIAQNTAVTTQPTPQPTPQPTTQEEVKIGAYQINPQPQTTQATNNSLLQRIKNGESFDFEGLSGLPRFEGQLQGNDPAIIDLQAGTPLRFSGAKLGYIGSDSDSRNGSYVAYKDPQGGVLVIAGCKAETNLTPGSIVDATNAGLQSLCTADDSNIDPSTGAKPESIYRFQSGSRSPVVYSSPESPTEPTTQNPAVQPTPQAQPTQTPVEQPSEQDQCANTNLFREIFRWNSPCIGPF